MVSNVHVDTNHAALASSLLSEQARAFRESVEDPKQFLSSCDGGDPGTPEQPSVWLFGVEPGWSLEDARGADLPEGQDVPRGDRYPVEQQLQWPFNRNAFKLLSALDGGHPSDFREFALRVRPFEKGCKGFFKGNLFPLALNKIATWHADAQRHTGFQEKGQYQEWVRRVRFPIIASQIATCRPGLVICAGTSHLSDFLAVTQTPDAQPHTFSVNGHVKRMYLSRSGLVPVAVVPHLSGGANGLNSDAAVAMAADLIKRHVLFPE